ncbi:unnamed protein product [Mesocestoides corti]|uniref:G_PROTEIN_RECEP_F1_2 domain-containing protein n=1 Tax=Mesocestoides corti TaxID=53468 RepID=A0A0R3UAC6_MESCO|nr:unnamed protein product [Mesocestoides corti]
MLKDACNRLLPDEECFEPNYTAPWNENISLVEITQKIYIISVLYIGAPAICIGLVTSFLCVIVFCCFEVTQKTTRRLLIMNSVSDTFNLGALFISHILFELVPLGQYKALYIDSLDAVSNIAALSRNWSIVIIAFERYMLICYPIYLKTKITDQWVSHACIGLSVGTLIVRIPTVLTLILKNTGVCDAAVVSFSVDAFTDIFFFTIFPLILLSFFTIRILYESQRLRKWRKNEGSIDSERSMAYERMKRRVHGTIMAVLVTFTLLTIPFLPNGVIRVLTAFGDHSCLVYLGRHITASMSYIGTVLNSTVNCFIYILTWPKFRVCLWQICIFPFVFCLHPNRKMSKTVVDERTVQSQTERPSIDARLDIDY